MFTLGLTSVGLAVIAGLTIKFLLEFNPQSFEGRISWREFAIGTALIAVVLVPLTIHIGWKAARANNLSFNEYYNGWEVRAIAQPIACERDGSCRYEYDCDPYPVIVSYSCNCDEDGCSVCFRTEIHYHSCPYVKTETTYAVQTTLGEFTIAEHRFPNDPQTQRWRERESVPQHLIDSAGVGEPPFWAAAKQRLDSGKPGPVTKRMSYDNYILASDRSILRQYSAEIERYKSHGLLPALQSGIRDFYLADKLYFVGFNPPNQEEWQKKLQYLNAGLGFELQADLHLVITQNKEISGNPDMYLLALKAHWQDPAVFGKDAISKNTVMIVMGTEDGKNVSWARAITGMPLGNERLVTAIRELNGVPLVPDILIGNVGLSSKSVTVDGVLSGIFWGRKDPGTKFKRVVMGGKDDGNSSGFTYLVNEIEITPRQRFWIGVCAFIGSLLIWMIAVLVDDDELFGSTRQARRHY